MIRLMAIILMYMLMVILFGSLVLPLAVLMSLPLSVVGAFGAMALTDTAIRKPMPGTKPQKLADGGGLYQLLLPTGARWWRWAMRHA